MTHTDEPGGSEFWVRLIADVILRVAYFVGTALFLLFAFGGRPYLRWNLETYPDYLAGILVSSVLSALFGPWLYRSIAHRGRGDLNRTREASRRDQ